MNHQFPNVAPDFVYPHHVRVRISGLDRVLNPVQFQVVPLQNGHILLYDPGQEVVQEPFQAGNAPAAGFRNLGDHAPDRPAGVDEHDALLVQSESEPGPVGVQVVPVGNQELARQGVVVDLRFRVVNVVNVQFQVNSHVEAVLLLLPLLRRQDRHILPASLPQFRLHARLYGMLDEIEHPVFLLPGFFPRGRRCSGISVRIVPQKQEMGNPFPCLA